MAAAFGVAICWGRSLPALTDTTEAEQVMAWFSVRHVLAAGPRDQNGILNYEERVTLWEADGFDAAFALARSEAEADAAELLHDGTALDLFQVYRLAEHTPGDADLPTFPVTDKALSAVQGAEVFSLVRESDLSPSEYLDRFFDTGSEWESTRVRIYRADAVDVPELRDTPGTAGD